MNPDINQLIAYLFEKLRALKSSVTASDEKSHIALSIGEPRHPPAAFVAPEINAHLQSGIGKYPLAKGLQTPMIVILIGAIGGMMLQGILGLFIGPVVLAIMHMFMKEF